MPMLRMKRAEKLKELNGHNDRSIWFFLFLCGFHKNGGKKVLFLCPGRGIFGKIARKMHKKAEFIKLF